MEAIEELRQAEFKLVVEKWKKSENKSQLLSDVFLLGYIYNTNKLEGINLTYHQTKEIFESETIRNYNGDVRGLFSVLNSHKTFEFLVNAWKDDKDVDLNFVKDLHRIALRNSFDKRRYEENGERPGEFKKHDYAVGRYDAGVEPEAVEQSLELLIEFIKSKEGKDPLRVATVLHCEFECIHPFSDGNGRVGRWLMNYYLITHGYPPLIVFEEDKMEYYTILEKYDLEQEPLAMYEFLKRQMVKTWTKKIRHTEFSKTGRFLDE